ncbi:MAG TPA: sugar ABC transporter substrate-binding protein [Sphaerochaeta sp.]|jgi:ribose transport system substrate-binding protein|nr:sugar ABC transporter substrate-binding protein [Sphaerochaeta sp.]HQB05183.1 sugar ABC transporter substrate-binding protein [Sphaerochaeta sp.]
MKKVLSVCLILVLLVASVFAQGTRETSGKIRVGFANINEKGSFGKMVLQNMKKVAAERGYDIITVDNNSDGATAVANADTLLAMDIDYMIEFNVDKSVAPVIMEKFNAKKIPVIAIDIEHEGAIFFGADNKRAGTLAGETAGDWVNKNWNGKVDYIVLIIQPVSGPAVAPRVEMFPQGLRNKGIAFADSQIVRIDGQNDAQYTQARFADFLLAHPEAKRVAVATINDVAASGVYAAAETAGRADQIVLVSQNATADFVEPMYARNGKTNWIASIAYFPNRYGEFVFNLIDKMVAGETVPQNNYIDHLAITWDNIATWYPKDNLPWKGL